MISSHCKNSEQRGDKDDRNTNLVRLKKRDLAWGGCERRSEVQIATFDETDSGFCIVKKLAWCVDIVCTESGLMMALGCIPTQACHTPAASFRSHALLF